MLMSQEQFYNKMSCKLSSVKLCEAPVSKTFQGEELWEKSTNLIQSPIGQNLYPWVLTPPHSLGTNRILWCLTCKCKQESPNGKQEVCGIGIRWDIVADAHR